MSGTARDPAHGATGSRGRALAALCVTEIVSYGVIYYAFPVLATAISAGTGWSRAAITAAYSAGNLAGALVGIPVGRLLHKRGPRPVMTAAGVPGPVFVQVNSALCRAANGEVFTFSPDLGKCGLAGGLATG